MKCLCFFPICLRTFRHHQQQSFFRAPSLTIRYGRASVQKHFCEYEKCGQANKLHYLHQPLFFLCFARFAMVIFTNPHWNLKKAHESGFTSSLSSSTMLHTTMVPQIRFPIVFLCLSIKQSSHIFRYEQWLRAKAPDYKKRSPENDLNSKAHFCQTRCGYVSMRWNDGTENSVRWKNQTIASKRHYAHADSRAHQRLSDNESTHLLKHSPYEFVRSRSMCCTNGIGLLFSPCLW